MSNSIFSKFSLDRDVVRWEEYLGIHTPWENHEGIWFKREDYFAPLGYSGPNGSKMRQLIWYINKFKSGKNHIVTGASIQSPQLSMTAIVGAHYGLKSREVVYSKPETVLKHTNPQIAYGFGAEFEYATGPYNPIIQRKVERLTQTTSLVVEYGITLPIEKYNSDNVRKFHEVGANQTLNTPKEIERLIVPAGSCNSLTSILLGLSRNEHNIKELFTLGIGPEKQDWVAQRLQYMGVNSSPASWPFKWRHHSLHETGYSKYSDHFNGEKFSTIKFHPTYEAKMWRWLKENEPLSNDNKTGFWIVGSEPDVKVVKPFYTRTT